MATLMKGKKWKDYREKVTYPVFVEDKVDEIRCHVIVTPGESEVRFLSYAGKPLANMERFSAAFLSVAHYLCLYEFDCGFEVNGNFNDSYRWVRSTNGLKKDQQDLPYKFYIFDIPALDQMSYVLRRQRIGAVAHRLILQGINATTLAQMLVGSEDDVDRLYLNAIERGVEGLMIKTPEHMYQKGKRINGWLKYKPEEDADGTIVGLLEACASKDDPDRGVVCGDPLGRIGSVVLRMEDGSTASPHGIPHDLGVDMFLNPHLYLHECCEFQYMMRDRQGGYRHPVFKRIREATS